MTILRVASLLIALALAACGPDTGNLAFDRAYANAWPVGQGNGHEVLSEKSIEIAALIPGNQIARSSPYWKERTEVLVTRTVDRALRYAAELAAQRGWEAFELRMAPQGWRETTTRGATAVSTYDGYYLRAFMTVVAPGRAPASGAVVYRTRDIQSAPREPLLTHPSL